VLHPLSSACARTPILRQVTVSSLLKLRRTPHTARHLAPACRLPVLGGQAMQRCRHESRAHAQQWNVYGFGIGLILFRRMPRKLCLWRASACTGSSGIGRRPRAGGRPRCCSTRLRTRSCRACCLKAELMCRRMSNERSSLLVLGRRWAARTARALSAAVSSTELVLLKMSRVG
jgi:hypothetical protein